MKEEIIKRTSKFSKDIIDLIGLVPKNLVNITLIKQLIKSATSIGANYQEACEAETRKDFQHKLGVCKKESRETLYWLELLGHSSKNSAKQIEGLIQEGKQLLLIFSKSIKTSKEKAILENMGASC